MTNIFKKLLEEAKNSYDDFNAADGKIGDGDLGVTILHGLEEINNSISEFSDDMGINFMLCSRAFVKKSGSSFGTLIAFSFMNISKNLKGKNQCNHDDIIAIFDTALKSSTKQALEDFKGKKIKIGRARMFEDKTMDLDDPGMFALNRLSSAFYGK